MKHHQMNLFYVFFNAEPIADPNTHQIHSFCTLYHCIYLASSYVARYVILHLFTFFVLLPKLKNNNRPKCQTIFNCYYRFIWGSATMSYMIASLPACLPARLPICLYMLNVELKSPINLPIL